MLPPIGSRKSPIYRARISVFTHKKGGGNVRAVVWICACGNANARIRWNEYTYSIMWKHVIDNVDMRVRWCECTYLVMRICIFDNVRIRARWIGPLRLAGCSLRISRIVRWHFAECFVCISLVFATLSQSVSSRRGPIYRARISVFTHKMANGYVRVIKWMHIFNNVKTRNW